MIKKILLGFVFTLMMLPAQMPNTKQLIVVTTKNWSASHGQLQRLEKVNHQWHRVGKTIAIKLGRNGLGWGIGLHITPSDASVVKKEGDGKAPAGIFSLKQAFGYFPFVTAYPYEVYKSSDHCVDDIHSTLYNKIVDSHKVKRDYKSKESMRFSKNYYKYGIVVNHNHIDERGAVKGAGSCIFIHIKRTPTAGCTVMNEEQMKELIGWLSLEDNPLLVQGTEEIMGKLLNKATGIHNFKL